MATVLLVEDDPAARQGLELALRRLGYEVRLAETGEVALDGISGAAMDVVVLDVMLPGVDGFEVCRRLRRDSDVPVIMLTARGHDFDIVAGLEAGADDYVVKPVQPRVLDARIRAVLRRMARACSPPETSGELVIDRGSLTVPLRRREISLTPTELPVRGCCPPLPHAGAVEPVSSLPDPDPRSRRQAGFGNRRDDRQPGKHWCLQSSMARCHPATRT